MLEALRKAAQESGADADEVKLPPFTLHDIRRTVATGMQRLGIAPHITEAVLNHKSGVIKGVAAVYARHDYADEKRKALVAWGDELEATTK
jgi:integrase